MHAWLSSSSNAPIPKPFQFLSVQGFTLHSATHTHTQEGMGLGELVLILFLGVRTPAQSSEGAFLGSHGLPQKDLWNQAEAKLETPSPAPFKPC